jgi:para-nitrobenzyl esterase
MAPRNLLYAGLVAALAAVGSAASSPHLSALPPGVPDEVATEGGTVAGVRAVPSNLRYWLGVPYAADTGGNNAFRPPQPLQPWAGTRDASAFGPGCLQPHHNPGAS